MANPIYLGKRGKISGPFSAEDLERLRSSGEISNYTYLWNEESRSWTNLEAPPPPPLGTKRAASSQRGWEAICSSGGHLLSGRVENVSPEGCDLVVSHGSDSPDLAQASALILNVLDPAKKRAMNVKATLSGVYRHDGKWVYRLDWPSAPEF
jgi:GYF domain 2